MPNKPTSRNIGTHLKSEENHAHVNIGGGGKTYLYAYEKQQSRQYYYQEHIASGIKQQNSIRVFVNTWSRLLLHKNTCNRLTWRKVLLQNMRNKSKKLKARGGHNSSKRHNLIFRGVIRIKSFNSEMINTSTFPPSNNTFTT